MQFRRYRLSLLLTACLALAFPVSALAQRGGGPDGPVPAPLLNRLGITPEQQTKIRSAVDAYQAEMRKAEGLTTREERGQVARTAAEGYRAALAAALTPEQQKQLQGLLEEARSLGPLGPQLVVLDLTEPQKVKLKEIAARAQADVEKLRAEGVEGPALRTRYGEITGRMLDESRAVLTPEQQKQFQPPDPRRGSMLPTVVPSALLATLSLTPEQEAKAKAAADAFQAEANRASTLDRAQRGELFRKAAEAYTAAMREALTPAQMQRLQAAYAEAAQLGPLGLRLVALDLSADQRAKLREIAARHRPEFEKLAAVGREPANREAFRAQYDEVMKKVTEEVRPVLTDTQRQKLDTPDPGRGRG